MAALASNISSAEYRPGWRPGAVQKALVRKYRQVRGEIDMQALKRKEMLKRVKTKKDVKKPSLIVKKVDGEYTVQMEVMKVFSHERLQFQYPYEDKPPVIFNVGRTEQENEKRQRKKERRERRETRGKSEYIQSQFRDMCKEVCLKTYQQAIGILPNPNPNDPNCPCFPQKPDRISLTADSCSCADSNGLSSSTDTDGDEWFIEFTPPTAKYDPDAKRPPVLVSRESQYNYLDFRVKLLDKNGQAVPRFFIGPDGKQVCSDLGGFWGPDGTWLEIGRDGYIAADGRWVPMTFIGPDGTLINAEDGFFTDAYGRTFEIGVDGYIGKDGKWIFYPPGPKPPYPPIGMMSKTSDVSTWTCFGDITPSELALLAFKPHGPDRAKLKKRLEDRERLTGSREPTMPKGKIVPRFRGGKMIEPKTSTTAIKPAKSLVSFKDSKGRTARFKEDERKDAARGSRSPDAARGSRSPDAARGSRSPEAARGSRSPDAARGSKSPDTGRGTKSPDQGRGSPSRGQPQGSGGRSIGGSPTSDRKRGAKVTSSETSRNKSPDTRRMSRSPPGIQGSDECDISDKRAAAWKMLKDGKINLDDKKICKLARMAADGRHIAGSHKDCFAQAIGDCCVESGGICTEIFAAAHNTDGEGPPTSPAPPKSPGSRRKSSDVSAARPGKTAVKSSSKSPSPGARQKSPGKSAPGSPPSGARNKSPDSTRFGDTPGYSGEQDISDKRAAAMNMLKSGKIAKDDKKICKLARMAADGRHISGSHKDCFAQAIGDCCVEQDGICTEIFAIAHNK